MVFGVIVDHQIKKFLSKSKTHLDFGCGEGELIFKFAKHLPNINFLGIDINRRKITKAKKYSMHNLRFRVDNKIRKKYNSISAFFVLHEIQGNLGGYLSHMNMQLTDKGHIIIFDYRKVSKKKFMKWYEDRKNKREFGTFQEEYIEHNRWTIPQFVSMMGSLGFKKVLAEPAGDFYMLYIGEKK